MKLSQTFKEGTAYPSTDDLKAAVHASFDERSEIPGVARTDIDLARITPGAKKAEDHNAIAYAVMHPECRDGGEHVLRWLGEAQTLDWLTGLVGDSPLVFATTFRKCGSDLPAPAVPVYGTTEQASDVWAVSIRLDKGEEPVRCTVEGEGEAPGAPIAVAAGEAVAIRHDAVRSFETGPEGALLFEFFVVGTGDGDGPPLAEWNEKQLASRRRLIGLAQRAAQPDRADEITQSFQPPLRSDEEELPLIRILAPPAPPTATRTAEDE